MFGPDARIVQAGRDRVDSGDLSVLVGEHRRARAVEHGAAGRCRATPPPPASTPTSRTSLVVQEAVEDPDRVRAAADARHDGLGQPLLGGERVLPRLAADHRLQLGDELGIRRRADAGADQVVGVSTFVIQSRIASLVASFSVFSPA